jgi:hypothetical protein
MLFFFPIGFFIIFSYFFSLYISLLKIDLRNHLRIFLVPLIKQLSDQIDEKALIFLDLDFSSPVTEDKLVKTGESGNNGLARIFQHHWIDGKIILKDRVVIYWNVEDIVRQRQTKFSDKTEKMKFRDYEILHRLDFEFHAPSDRYQPVQANLQEKEGWIIIKLMKESTSGSLDQGVDPELFIGCVDEAYKMVRSISL